MPNTDRSIQSEVVHAGNLTKPDLETMRKTAAMAKYRAANRRFDYVPCREALRAIHRHRGLDIALAGVIDKLILAGDRAISGNA